MAESSEDSAASPARSLARSRALATTAIAQNAYLFCRQLTEGYICRIVNDICVVEAPACALYPMLPRVVHAYILGRAPEGATVDWRIEHSASEQHIFSFAPPAISLSVPSYHPVATEHYVRLALRGSAQACPENREYSLHRLGDDAHPELARLYRETGVSRYHLGALRDGFFLGLFHGPDLVGAIGTHFVDHKFSIAMVGFLVVRSEFRGHGLAYWLTSRHLSLLRPHFTTIVCDVEPSNAPSLSLLERAGYMRLPGLFKGAMLERNGDAQEVS
ncbi:GNAT family N-acetyltransferase [Frankia sp. AgB32]|uniref:GNAT family N-acetyltransferase n=1 Tax=Frankia sp. AgB32 TaxID=631119 RepID=UPI00200F3961|nr:GNAT family N-acetyltransferase [Frankia sp. AgB32]MCK9895089.1 GNAT family N-acetyltransferase [Frankia sp. AgB32]